MSVVLVVSCCVFFISYYSEAASTKHFRLVLDRPANPNHVPIYVGHALGYFREEGIFLEIQKPTTDSPISEIDKGTAEFVLTSLPRAFRAIARKSNICILGKVVDKPLKGFLVLQSSGMKGIQDFNGRIMGYDGAYSIFPSAEIILDLNNIQVGCKLNMYDEALNELVSKKIDVVYGVLANLEPEYLQSLGHKVRFFLGTDLGMPVYDEIVVAAHARVKNNSRLIESFQKALQKSIDFCTDKPELAFEMYANLQQNKSRKTVLWEEASWKKTVPHLASSQTFSYDPVKTLADWQYEHELVATPIEVNSHFVTSLSR